MYGKRGRLAPFWVWFPTSTPANSNKYLLSIILWINLLNRWCRNRKIYPIILYSTYYSNEFRNVATFACKGVQEYILYPHSTSSCLRTNFGILFLNSILTISFTSTSLIDHQFSQFIRPSVSNQGNEAQPIDSKAVFMCFSKWIVESRYFVVAEFGVPVSYFENRNSEFCWCVLSERKSISGTPESMRNRELPNPHGFRSSRDQFLLIPNHVYFHPMAK